MRPRASPTGSWVSICWTARLQQRNTPRRPTAMIASQSSSPVSSRPFEWGPATIAFGTITSSRPVRSTAVRTSRSMSPAREASDWTNVPRPPCSTIRSTVGRPPSRGSARTSPTTTSAPSAAKRSAIARPRPEEPPVTTIDFPAKRATAPIVDARAHPRKRGWQKRASSDRPMP